MMMLINNDDGTNPIETHDINVTPLIDVMLVLLIIFMIAAPLATVDLPVDLPRTSASAHQPPSDPVYLTLRRDLTVAIGETTVDHKLLPITLREAMTSQDAQRIFLRADKQVTYDDLMGLLNTLQQAGFHEVALMGIQQAPGESHLPP